MSIQLSHEHALVIALVKPAAEGEVLLFGGRVGEGALVEVGATCGLEREASEEGTARC